MHLGLHLGLHLVGLDWGLLEDRLLGLELELRLLLFSVIELLLLGVGHLLLLGNVKDVIALLLLWLRVASKKTGDILGNICKETNRFLLLRVFFRGLLFFGWSFFTFHGYILRFVL